MGGAKDFAAAMLTLEAYDAALFGDQANARQKAARALEISGDHDTQGAAALAFATAGDVQKSASLVSALQRDVPENRFIQSLIIPEVQAMEHLAKNQFSEAIQTLEPLRPYEFGTGPRAVGVTPVYWRGVAYLKLHDGAKAAAEFQRILDHRGAAGFASEYPLAQLNLARAYVIQGDNAKARTKYQDFFAAWKDADPDIPVLIAAKAEYDKLK